MDSISTLSAGSRAAFSYLARDEVVQLGLLNQITFVIPAQAGIQGTVIERDSWIPACAGNAVNDFCLGYLSIGMDMEQ